MCTKTIDVRELAPPGPFEVALQAIAELGGDDELVLLHRREPFPLYDVLADLGFTHHVERLEGDFRIVIRRRPRQAP